MVVSMLLMADGSLWRQAKIYHSIMADDIAAYGGSMTFVIKITI